MALTLILMRHAKSSWSDPSQGDFDRPLNGRGKKSAPAIARWLCQKGYLPDLVLVSGARRTVETWERMAGQLPEAIDVKTARELYLAEPWVILDVLQRQTHQSIMMIGHNPGFAWFANQLAKSPSSHPRFEDYPTAATTVFGLETQTWKDTMFGTAQILDFAIPRDLLA